MHPLESIRKIFVVLFLIFLTFLILFFFISIKSSVQEPKKENIVNTYDFEKELSQIEATAFYVYDINSQKVLFAKNEHEKLPLASITKLMTGFVVLDILPEKTLVKIKKEDIALGSGTGLVVGESWKLRDLLNFSLITSSNDGIHAISSLANSIMEDNLIYLMNIKAKEFGLSDTIFINETGLDINEELSGAYSSAYDVAKLLQIILKKNPALIKETKKISEKFISESNIAHYAYNTNSSINNIPAIIASKTGFTDLAGGNLAIIFDGGFNYPIIAVVLGSSQKGRFTDIEKLVKLSLIKISL